MSHGIVSAADDSEREMGENSSLGSGMQRLRVQGSDCASAPGGGGVALLVHRPRHSDEPEYTPYALNSEFGVFGGLC